MNRETSGRKPPLQIGILEIFGVEAFIFRFTGPKRSKRSLMLTEIKIGLSFGKENRNIRDPNP